MKIVMLDKKTLGDDCDLSELQKMGDFIAYDEIKTIRLKE